MSSLYYRFRLWPALAAVAGIALTLTLGYWQLGRGEEKMAMQQQLEQRSRLPPVVLSAREFDPRELEWRQVSVRGRFERKYAVYIDNRIHRGTAGYHVVMPLRIARSDMHVLVNRGWIAAAGTRATVPAVKTPEDDVEIRGVVALPSKRFVELSTKIAEGNVWQNLVIERYRQAVPIRIHPLVILQESAADDGLAREWQPPDAGANQNFAYAVQWFAMAAAIAILYLVTNVRKRRPD